MKKKFTAFTAIAAVLFIAATASAQSEADQGETGQIENAFRGVMQDRSASSFDEELYVEKCSMCHRQMGMGTVILARRMDPAKAILENRENLTAQFITITARQGIGNMPRISEAEVTDEQMERIARYLVEVSAPAQDAPQ
ncbi:MAG: cytochrome c [Alteraurantiacibacter sp.]